MSSPPSSPINNQTTKMSGVILAIPLRSVAPKKKRRNEGLPEGWRMWTTVRKTGQVDVFYRDPEDQYTFRSRVAVDAYLNDGTLPKELRSKAKKKSKAPTTSGSPTRQKQKKHKPDTSTSAGADGNGKSEAAAA